MSEENEVLAAEPAPEQLDTAAIDPEVAAEPEAQPEVKTFTQEEFDKIVSREKAKARRQAEREFAARAEAKKADVNVSPENFETTEAYIEALAEKKAAELVEQREMKRQSVDVEASFRDKEDEAREKYADYEQVAYTAPISDLMAEVIKASDIGPELAYHLGKNPDEALRIAKMSPLLQAKEIGKLEVKLAAMPKNEQPTTKAPAPISPVTAGSVAKVYDTTDPRSIKAMSTSDWIEAERARQRKRMEARL